LKTKPEMLQAARHAMATRFEIVLYGKDTVSLRAAAEEALDEVQRIESKISIYRSDSEIAHLNARAAHEPVRVSPEVFRLLEWIKRLSAETSGAFDVTIGPLMRAWGFVGDSGHLPDPEQLEQARGCVGMHLVELDGAKMSVRFARPGVMLDFGAVGKGYAIEKAAEIVREAGVTSALIHGGTSTSYAIGTPPDQSAWNIAIDHPMADGAGKPRVLAVVPLVDSALSVSAVSGKSFSSGEITYGHILDPRTGSPANKALLAAVSVPSATESDALSTALLTLGTDQHDVISGLRPEIRTLVVERSDRNALGFNVAAHKIGVL
jgi:FAD:protein FMN transferase